MQEARGNGQGVGDQTARKRARTEPYMVMTSGLDSEVFKFQWSIKDFSRIRHNETLLKSQSVTVTTGTGVGVPCTWMFSLNLGAYPATPGEPVAPAPVSGDSAKWLDVDRKLVHAPENTPEVVNLCSIKIKDKDGRSFFKGNGNVNFMRLNGIRTYKKVLKLSEPEDRLPLMDKCLMIQITLTTFIQRPVEAKDVNVIPTFKTTVHQKLSADLTQLLTENSPTADFKIVSKDGKEFNVHRWILSARNEVFKAMFASEFLEHRSGLLNVNDLSGKAVELLLKYLYGGAFDEKEWLKPDLIVEMTYTAGKYQLTEVLELMDNVLGKYGKSHAWTLLNLAGKLSLKKAEQSLLTYIKVRAIQKASSASELSSIFEDNDFDFVG